MPLPYPACKTASSASNAVKSAEKAFVENRQRADGSLSAIQCTRTDPSRWCMQSRTSSHTPSVATNGGCIKHTQKTCGRRDHLPPPKLKFQALNCRLRRVAGRVHCKQGRQEQSSERLTCCVICQLTRTVGSCVQGETEIIVVAGQNNLNAL